MQGPIGARQTDRFPAPGLYPTDRLDAELPIEESRQSSPLDCSVAVAARLFVSVNNRNPASRNRRNASGTSGWEGIEETACLIANTSCLLID